MVVLLKSDDNVGDSPWDLASLFGKERLLFLYCYYVFVVRFWSTSV